MWYRYTCPECGHSEVTDVQEPRECKDCLCDMEWELVDGAYDEEYEDN